MVDDSGRRRDSPLVPSIADLLTQYRDRTGASYDDMSRSVRGEITSAWFHKLTTSSPKSFPRDPGTLANLADLLQVSIPTILNAFAISLGLPVSDTASRLALTLPPGTDSLEPADVEAIRAVIRQLIAARNAAQHTHIAAHDPVAPDMSRVQGLRLAEDTPTPVRNDHDT